MTRGAWVPPVDIYETSNHELVLKAELPDVPREDIALRVENNTLTISGQRKMDDEVKEEQYHRIERASGSFSRSFTLPPTVDTGAIGGRVQERRPHRAAPAARRSQAEADSGAGELAGRTGRNDIRGSGPNALAPGSVLPSRPPRPSSRSLARDSFLSQASALGTMSSLWLKKLT